MGDLWFFLSFKNTPGHGGNMEGNDVFFFSLQNDSVDKKTQKKNHKPRFCPALEFS